MAPRDSRTTRPGFPATIHTPAAPLSLSAGYLRALGQETRKYPAPSDGAYEGQPSYVTSSVIWPTPVSAFEMGHPTFAASAAALKPASSMPDA